MQRRRDVASRESVDSAFLAAMFLWHEQWQIRTDQIIIRTRILRSAFQPAFPTTQVIASEEQEQYEMLDDWKSDGSHDAEAFGKTTVRQKAFLELLFDSQQAVVSA